jgi:hypothetical protein
MKSSSRVIGRWFLMCEFLRSLLEEITDFFLNENSLSTEKLSTEKNSIVDKELGGERITIIGG